jgi:serine phosphatase RsbU (regulator of sigma subunit)
VALNSSLVAHVTSAVVVRPKFGHAVGGDAAFVVPTKQGLLAAVVDVLGHGKDAHELAVPMQQHLVANASGNVVEMLSQLHHAYRGSRGAAVGLCVIDPASARLRFAGIGNTVIRRFGDSESRLVSRDGIVGGTMRTPVEETLDLSAGDVIMMYTDGVRSHFDPSACVRLRTDTPHAMAASVIHWFGKPHDDASCVVLRYER